MKGKHKKQVQCEINRTNEATGKPAETRSQHNPHTHTHTHTHNISETINETTARNVERTGAAEGPLVVGTALAITADSNCLVDTYLASPSTSHSPIHPFTTHSLSLVILLAATWSQQTDITYTQ